MNLKQEAIVVPEIDVLQSESDLGGHWCIVAIDALVAAIGGHWWPWMHWGSSLSLALSLSLSFFLFSSFLSFFLSCFLSMYTDHIHV